MKIINYFFIIFIISIFLINQSYSLEDNNISEVINGNSSSTNSQEKIYDINPTISSLSSLELSQKVINFYSKFPRFDFTFSRINNTFNPKNESYIESIILTGFPFGILVILTIIVIISSVLAIIIIKARDYCRKKSQYRYKLIKYHKKSQRSTFKCIFSTTTTIILLVTVCSCLIVSLFVNQDLDSAVLLSIDNLESHLSNRVDIEEKVLKECRPVTYIPYDAIEIVSTTKRILNITTETKEKIHKYEYYRYEFIFISSMVLFALLSLGLLSIIIRFKIALALFIGLGLMVLCRVWVVPGTHRPMGVMISDICPQMDQIIESYAPNNISPYVYFFLNCTDADRCKGGDSLIDQKINSLEVSLQRAKKYHFSNSTIHRLEDRIQGLYDLSRDSKDMLNCNITSNTFKSTQNLICIDIINSSFILSLLYVLIGLLLSISFITSLIVYSNSSIPKKSNDGYGILKYNNDDIGDFTNNKKSINSYYEDGLNTPLITSSIISDGYENDSDYDNDDDISDF
ncbi:hypothetical protein DICPUDRAFT_154135 [Dictyostelium purpureum]|uniref:Uncharacterized protein n=1 Tax=Dictyostelium purpureum TaxID=5786 RepID=F0ZQN2_DICPU|nr:uncharacterized protein DICPUDRAFT_154135 [Dictyostelium purpureum]EGC33760.1 hypothetical protein DICPUDRAFT_154135 [Dictyostelium purpureum]|eukprot:XP_003289726.1 hypothetical protein DICPUDRAFT_154135 [Dictyostelium purpureum]